MLTSNVLPPSSAEEHIDSDHIGDCFNSSLVIMWPGFSMKYFKRSARMPGSLRIVPLHQTSLFSKSMMVFFSLTVFDFSQFDLVQCRRRACILFIKIFADDCFPITTSFTPASKSFSSAAMFILDIKTVIIACVFPERINEQKSNISLFAES